MSGSTHARSSQLSKTLNDVLHDKDALAYFISYLQSLNADNLVRFWLDVEAFRLAAERTTSTEADDQIPPAEPVRLAATCDPAMRLAAEQTPPTSIHKTVECNSRTPEVTQQSRVPTNYCGHASSSASNSPKAVGRLPAHGEVVSTDAAVLPSSSAAPSGYFRPPVDCCPASNPSVIPSDQPHYGDVVDSSVKPKSLTVSSALSESPRKGFVISI